MLFQNEHMSPEVLARIRQYYRILLSYGDFKQAKYTASYILENKLHDMVDQRLLEPLICAMIVAYSRPFSGNDKSVTPKIPDLPFSFLKGVTKKEMEIHKIVLEDRNTVIAHSDSITAQLQPEVWNINGNRILVPWQNDRRAPLTLSVTRIFNSLANKMFEKVVHEQKRLEPEMIPFFMKNNVKYAF